MANQIGKLLWVLVLVQLVVGCMDGGQFQEVEGGDVGVVEDVGLVVKAGDVGDVVIREGAVDLRAQAVAEVVDAVEVVEEVVEEPVVEAVAGGGLGPLSGKEMRILGVNLQEVEQGFQLSIPCTDDSVDGYFYDYERGGERSERCEIDAASARASITFEPAVSYRLASTGTELLVMGDFERRKYTVRIKAGLRTRDGGVLGKDFESSFEVKKLSPALQFVSKGRFMPRQAWHEVMLSHRNVEVAELEVWHVPSRNMAFWMSGYGEQVDGRTGDLVLSRQLQLGGAVDKPLTTALPMSALMGAPKPGLYEVRIEGGLLVDMLRVVVTDIQLIAKRNKGELVEDVDVWAIDSQTMAPIVGAKVRAVLQSGTVVAHCVTNSEGHCRVRVEKVDAKSVQVRAPFALVVSHKDDATYLKYSELRTELARGETHGAPYNDDGAYKGFVYGDRDLYRPADVVHVAAMLRDKDLVSVGAGVPVEMVVVDSRAQVVARKSLETNAGGMVVLDHRLSELAVTGQWRVRLEVGKREVAVFKFGVEEFMPERLKVEASAKVENIGAGDVFEVDVHARYLFGASAEGSDVTMRCQQVAVPFQPAKNAGYHYGVVARGDSYGEKEKEGRVVEARSKVIDGGDRAVMGCDFAANQAEMVSTAKLRAEVGVSESGSGRTTHAVAEGWRHPAAYYVGIRRAQEDVKIGQPVAMDGVIVDWEGALRKDVGHVDVEVVQVREQWGRSSRTGRYERRWIEIAEHAKRLKVVGGKFVYSFTPRSNRYEYLVRVRSGEARTELMVSRTYDDWDDDCWRYDECDEDEGWGRNRRNASVTPRAKKAGSLVLASRGEVGIGRAHTVRFESEFKGRALMTVETDEVLRSAWIDVEPGPVTWGFTVDAFAPNVYVSAMLIKNPHAESAESYLPERAFGALSIPMERGKFTQKLGMKTPDSVRPGTRLDVQIDVGKEAAGSYVTVAAVDEGILSLTKYKTPNPLDSLLTRRALGVMTYDTIGWTLQLANMNPRSKTGGSDDEAAGGLGRIMPFKPVALWSGLKRVPKNGKLTVSMDVPLYQGELRVMAVVVGDERIGRAENRVKVRDPIVVQATFPRFLITSDVVDIPVFLSNTTGSKQEIEVEIAAEELAVPGLVASPNSEPVIGLEGVKKHVVSVGPAQSKTVLFRARALRSVGAATFVVSAKGQSETGSVLESRAEGVVPFRMAGPKERKVETVMVSTQNVDLSKYLKGWEPTSETTTFRVTTNPNGGAFDHLSALARYPYGCLEQTISQLRPMVYLSKLVSAVDPELVAKNQGIDKMIESGISRVLSMQTRSGGFGFWSGNGEPHPWATPYAIYLLMDASKRGFSVPEERITQALDWLVNEVNRQESDGYGRSGVYAERYSPGFSYYVLALAGRANQGQIRKVIATVGKGVKGEELESVYLMKAAFYLSGDRSYEADLKQISVDLKEEGAGNYRSYYSNRRRNALMLNVFVDLFGQHKNGLALVDQLGKEFSKTQNVGYMYSTQEMGWGLTALGKWFEGSEDSVDAKVVADGRAVKSELVAGKSGGANWGIVRASEYSELRLELGVVPEKPLYLVVSSEGVRTKPTVVFGGEGMSVTREYLNEKGEKIEGKVGLGELVYVRVRLKSTVWRPLQNVALVDRLPAGFEIENPALGSEIRPGWVSANRVWNVDHMNVRDDRLEAFGTVYSGQEVELVYAVRATLAGKFHAPSVEVEGMYDTDVWARASYESIEVVHAWDALVD